MTHGARPLRSTRRLQNLTATLPRWYNIVRNESGPALVSIYDEIGYFGVSAQSFMDELRGINGDIELHLNSPGGDVFDGIAIYNQLCQRAGSVHIIVDSLAASAASFIAMAASPGMLEMAPHSQMMIHDGFGMVIGNAADMRETADLLDKASDNIASIYGDRTGKPAGYWRGKMRAETWYSDTEAVAEGLADKVQGQDTPKNEWDLSVYGRAPGSKPASDEQPPAPVPAVSNADVDNSPWDASKAWHNGAESDDPAAFYEGICAGRKSGDKSTQDAWALPYKYHPSDSPNAAGVRAALSRLPQTDGLTNEADARALLERLMKQVNPEYEPDDLAEPGLLAAAFLNALEGVNVR